MKNKIINYMVSMLCIVLIAISIYFNPDVIRVHTYEELTADDPPTFTGIITIWQISSWRVAQSSKTLVLLDAAKTFEKSHKMLYIEVENISYEDYIRKTSQGIYPDVLSFPAEMQIDYSMCLPIPIVTQLEPLYQKAYVASNNTAMPWLATSSVVLVNAQQASRKKCNVDKFQSNAQIATSIDLLSTSHEYVYGSPVAMIPLAISDVTLETVALPVSEYSAWLSFSRKECKILYGCVWQTYAMDRLLAKEKGFSTEYIYPYVDSDVLYWTQNFCVFSDEVNKNQLIFDYIHLVLSDNWQIKIADATASFPVTSAKLQYTGVRGEISKSTQRRLAIIPGLGISYDEIINALSGDTQAKLLLKEKLVFH